MGIEPTYAAWEAAVLPLNYTRSLKPFDASKYYQIAAQNILNNFISGQILVRSDP